MRAHVLFLFAATYPETSAGPGSETFSGRRSPSPAQISPLGKSSSEQLRRRKRSDTTPSSFRRLDQRLFSKRLFLYESFIYTTSGCFVLVPAVGEGGWVWRQAPGGPPPSWALESHWPGGRKPVSSVSPGKGSRAPASACSTQAFGARSPSGEPRSEKVCALSLA